MRVLVTVLAVRAVVVGRRAVEQRRRDQPRTDGHAFGEVRSDFGVYPLAVLGDGEVGPRPLDREVPVAVPDGMAEFERSEERRVGKECRL